VHQTNLIELNATLDDCATPTDGHLPRHVGSGGGYLLAEPDGGAWPARSSRRPRCARVRREGAEWTGPGRRV